MQTTTYVTALWKILNSSKIIFLKIWITTSTLIHLGHGEKQLCYCNLSSKTPIHCTRGEQIWYGHIRGSVAATSSAHLIKYIINDIGHIYIYDLSFSSWVPRELATNSQKRLSPWKRSHVLEDSGLMGVIKPLFVLVVLILHKKSALADYVVCSIQIAFILKNGPLFPKVQYPIALVFEHDFLTRFIIYLFFIGWTGSKAKHGSKYFGVFSWTVLV